MSKLDLPTDRTTANQRFDGWRGHWVMVVYKFYLRDPKQGDLLIGIMVERRKDPERITQESVMNWIKRIAFKFEVDENDIYFIPVDVKMEDDFKALEKFVDGSTLARYKKLYELFVKPA